MKDVLTSVSIFEARFRLLHWTCRLRGLATGVSESIDAIATSFR
jgi:hypothetical protein